MKTAKSTQAEIATAAPPPALPARIEKLLSELDKISDERKRHVEMASELQKQEDELQKTADLTDPKHFDQVNFVRRKREMIPGRIKAYDDATAKTTEELRKECDDLAANHSRAVNAKIEELTAAIANDIEKYFGPELGPVGFGGNLLTQMEGGVLGAPSAAEIIAQNSPAGQFLFKQKHWLKNGNFLSWPPARKANELIRMSSELAALKLTI